jgi:hypothetical protein
MILLNGSVIGTWKRQLGKESKVSLDFGQVLSSHEEELLGSSLKRFEKFYETTVVVV